MRQLGAVVAAAFLLAGLVGVVWGLDMTEYANSPANRYENPLADIGVAMSVGFTAVCALVSFVSALGLRAALAAIRRAKPPRPEPYYEPPRELRDM